MRELILIALALVAGYYLLSGRPARQQLAQAREELAAAAHVAREEGIPETVLVRGITRRLGRAPVEMMTAMRTRRG